MGGGFWYDPHVQLECMTLYGIAGPDREYHSFTPVHIQENSVVLLYRLGKHRYAGSVGLWPALPA